MNLLLLVRPVAGAGAVVASLDLGKRGGSIGIDGRVLFLVRRKPMGLLAVLHGLGLLLAVLHGLRRLALLLWLLRSILLPLLLRSG